MYSRTQKECSQEKISERHNHIEVFVHVPMVEQVVAIQTEEYSAAFHIPTSGQMHAPVEVFVYAIVRKTHELWNQKE